jgi:pimeloyl-ACP methyl ester carboxylesterase
MQQCCSGSNEYIFDPGRFSSLTTPTLLLLGGDSPTFFKAGIEVVHAALPDSQVHVMPGQQHAAINTAPELFTREVYEFLAQAG